MHKITRKGIRLLVGLSTSAIFVWLALRHVERREFVAAMSQIRAPALAFCVGVLAIEYWLRTVRWWLMIRTHDQAIALRRCVWPLLVSVAVNNVLPFRAGDALRVVGFRKQLQASTAHLLGTLVMERILDVTALVLFLLIGVAGLTPTGIPAIYLHLAALLSGGAIVVWGAALLGGQHLQGLLLKACRCRALQRRNWSCQAEHHVRQLMVGLSVMRSPQRAVQLSTLSIAIWTLDGVIFTTIAIDLGYEGSMFGPWFALAISTLSTVVPSSPGYVGTFDFFAMSGLMTYGAARPMAASFAFVVHAVLWLPLTIAGLAYLLMPRPASTDHQLRWRRREERT